LLQRFRVPGLAIDRQQSFLFNCPVVILLELVNGRADCAQIPMQFQFLGSFDVHLRKRHDEGRQNSHDNHRHDQLDQADPTACTQYAPHPGVKPTVYQWV